MAFKDIWSIHNISLSYGMHRDGHKSYHFTHEKTTVWKYLKGRAYCWLHWTAEKYLPKWYTEGAAKKYQFDDGFQWDMPRCADWDCKCYELNKHEVLGHCDVTEEQYNDLKGEAVRYPFTDVRLKKSPR